MRAPLAKPKISDANRRRESWRHLIGKQTGPRTVEGKARSGARSRTHGAFTADAFALRAYLRTVRELAKIAQCK